MEREYQVCSRCVMDTSDPYIVFDEKGHCNHCNTWFSKRSKSEQPKSPEEQRIELAKKIEKIKSEGQGKSYDCVIGISGGTDSTYLAYLAKREFGLKPLAVHLDNGWNSKLAVKNISNIVKRLDIDLHTHVIDWEEFKSLQLAYLKASVLDIEVLTDHAIKAILFKTASENDIQTILPGFNPDTEDIIPKAWTFSKNDLKNILDINKKFGTRDIRTFPLLGHQKMKNLTARISQVFIYRYFPFKQERAQQIIQDELRWKNYGGKHYESIFTRFYQGYILPRKFNIDKRRAHYSSQICMKVISREEALQKLLEPTYDKDLRQQDYDYVVKKFDLIAEEFEAIMNEPVRSHFDYATTLRSKIQKKLLVPTNPRLVKLKNWIKG